MKQAKVFTPFRVNGLDLRNRLLRSATAERLALPNGAPDERQAAMYRRLSAGGVGLLITGHAYVDPGGQCHDEMMGVHDDALIPDLARLAEAAHSGGAAAAVQINHGGRNCDEKIVGTTVGPSPIPATDGRPTPRALSRTEIAEIVSSFASAARRVKSAGFDAVQIHSAHGYLSSQFLSPLANHRRDEYGGDLRNRARFLREVARSIREAVGPDFPVLVKLGVTDNRYGGLTVDEGAEVASWLESYGIDALEVSTGLRGAIRSGVGDRVTEAYLLPFARQVRPRTGLPMALVGGLRSLEVMEGVLAEGIDLVSMSRPLICQPGFPLQLELGLADRSLCEACNRCWPDGPGQGISCKGPGSEGASDGVNGSASPNV